MLIIIKPADGLAGITKDGEPWFVASDVCNILDLGNPSQAISRLDDDEHTLISIEGSITGASANIVSESGLYSLILGSRKLEARDFKRWVIHEVLPSIRQTGSYSVAPLTPTGALLQAVQILDQQAKQLNALEEKVTIVNHRIDCLDSLDTIGDPQQRLNAMVRKYAQQSGLSFPQAWHDFRQAYNTAFRTNITMLLENASMRHGRKLTVPQFLAMTGRLEDAIRVADKMLNRQAAI